MPLRPIRPITPAERKFLDMAKEVPLKDCMSESNLREFARSLPDICMGGSLADYLTSVENDISGIEDEEERRVTQEVYNFTLDRYREAFLSNPQNEIEYGMSQIRQKLASLQA